MERGELDDFSKMFTSPKMSPLRPSASTGPFSSSSGGLITSRLAFRFLTMSCLSFFLAAADTASPPPLPPPEVEFSTREALVEAAFAAIKYLHEQMDDDHSGSVDLVESGGFIKEELSQVYRGKEGARVVGEGGMSHGRLPPLISKISSKLSFFLSKLQD